VQAAGAFKFLIILPDQDETLTKSAYTIQLYSCSCRTMRLEQILVEATQSTRVIEHCGGGNPKHTRIIGWLSRPLPSSTNDNRVATVLDYFFLACLLFDATFFDATFFDATFFDATFFDGSFFPSFLHTTLPAALLFFPNSLAVLF